jgi:hypothetical protein
MLYQHYVLNIAASGIVYAMNNLKSSRQWMRMVGGAGVGRIFSDFDGYQAVPARPSDKGLWKKGKALRSDEESEVRSGLCYKQNR